MGIGYTYKCKCSSPDPILIGTGMGYPILCEETWRDMSDGKYGENVRRIVKKYPRGGVDCEYKLYVCACGRWEVDTKKTVYEYGGPDHSGNARNIVYVFFHTCPECGRRMRVAPPRRAKLICPKCGEPMTDILPEIRWD